MHCYKLTLQVFLLKVWLSRHLLRNLCHLLQKGLLVEIGPEGGRRHNSPLKTLPSSEGDTAEGPPSEMGGKLCRFCYLH
jgi:hypothetical protein